MDMLILVDAEDNIAGYDEKENCHLIPTKLHRAFSIFIINSQGDMLIHKRSGLKNTWPGFWTNACCSHPREGESLEDATQRRLTEEMGFVCSLKYLFKFEYQSNYDKKYGENEVDNVFIGFYDGVLKPDKDEIEEWKFIGIKTLLEDVENYPAKYTPWFMKALPEVISYIQVQNPKLILGLIGSPRKLGNCEVFTKEISNQLDFNHKLNLIRLPSLNILPCNACYGCVMDKPCPNEDDMAFLLSQIVEADAIIMTSPIYYLGAHSIFKRILDRGFLFFTVLEKTYGKPCILINTYGIEGRIGAAPQALMTFAAFLGLDIKASLNIQSALPGEILMSEEGRQKAKDLAGILFSDKKIKNDDGCPFCGCEIVRMEKGKFICTLCHGCFAIDNQGKTIKIKDGGVLGTMEHMFKHKEWLCGMKDRFLQNKKEIVKTVIHYKDMGEWAKQ